MLVLSTSALRCQSRRVGVVFFLFFFFLTAISLGFILLIKFFFCEFLSLLKQHHKCGQRRRQQRLPTNAVLLFWRS